KGKVRSSAARNRPSADRDVARAIPVVLNQMIARLVYFDFFHTLMSQGILFWGHAADVHGIFVLQKRTICLIYKLSPSVSLRHLHFNVFRTGGAARGPGDPRFVSQLFTIFSMGNYGKLDTWNTVRHGTLESPTGISCARSPITHCASSVRMHGLSWLHINALLSSN
ncbi:hypothetical protein EVAR_62006_1, partial [Eumeta japonica]